MDELPVLNDSWHSDLNHELRGSLNAITGFADLLFSDAYGELTPEQRQAVADIMRATRRLRQVVFRMTDIGRADTGNLGLTPEVMSVRMAAEQVVRDLTPTARDHLVRLEADVAADLAVWADETRVRQILTELVANAVRHSPEGGTVTVGARAAGETVVIEVTDRGPGIAPEHLERVFEDFFSLATRDDPDAGPGLGLGLARRLARAMDGTLSVQSELGHGSVFAVSLPRREAPI
jgi:signal transduction histidine kinase